MGTVLTKEERTETLKTGLRQLPDAGLKRLWNWLETRKPVLLNGSIAVYPDTDFSDRREY